jgi:hypothetical protein
MTIICSGDNEQRVAFMKHACGHLLCAHHALLRNVDLVPTSVDETAIEHVTSIPKLVDHLCTIVHTWILHANPTYMYVWILVQLFFKV